MGNSPRDCDPGGQRLGFIFIWWGIVLKGSCPRTGEVSPFQVGLDSPRPLYENCPWYIRTRLQVGT